MSMRGDNKKGPQFQEKSGASRNKKPSGGSSSYEGYASPITEEPPPYSSPVHQRYKTFENLLAGHGSSSFDSHEEERSSSGNVQTGSALYDFTGGGDDDLNLTAAEEVENEYEVDGWFHLQVIHCCISRKNNCAIATESLDSVLKQASFKDSMAPSNGEKSLVYAKVSSRELVVTDQNI